MTLVALDVKSSHAILFVAQYLPHSNVWFPAQLHLWGLAKITLPLK